MIYVPAIYRGHNKSKTWKFAIVDGNAALATLMVSNHTRVESCIDMNLVVYDSFTGSKAINISWSRVFWRLVEDGQQEMHSVLNDDAHATEQLT